jgi:hypothetical protein
MAGRFDRRRQVQSFEQGIDDALEVEIIVETGRVAVPLVHLAPAGQQDRQPGQLVGQRPILAGQVDLADLEQGDAPPVAAVASGGLQHRR